MTDAPSDLKIWLVIVVMGIGTFLIRWSFLGVLGGRDLPVWVTRMLRYTPVAVLPALVAPLVVWPAATGGQIDPARMAAAAVTIVVGLWTRSMMTAILSGAVTLAVLLYWL